MYAAGSLGYCVIQQTTGGLMMYFGNVAHDVSGTLMGLAIAVGMICDAVNDPIVGHLSDRSAGALLGRRHGFMLIAVIAIPIINILLWALPEAMPAAGKFLWLMGGMALIEIFNTFFQTPYHALGNDLTGDTRERTVMQTLKTVFFLVGMAVPTVLMAVMLPSKTDVKEYAELAYVTSSIMLVFGAAAFMGTHNQIPRLRAAAFPVKPAEAPRLKNVLGGFFAVLKIKDFRALVIGYALATMGTAFIITIGMHLFEFTFGFSDSFGATAVLFGTMLAAAVVSQLVWARLPRLIDKKPSLILGLIIALFGLAYIAMIFVLHAYSGLVSDRPLGLLIVGMALIGFGLGANFMLPSAMLADFTQVQAARYNENRAGTYSAFMTFAYKIGQAVTSLIIGVMLDTVGFRAGTTVQSAGAGAGIGWILVAGTGTVLVAAAVLYKRYAIRRADVPEISQPVHDAEDEPI
jgi:Na+/melibiose symporter-like transporter